jgi:hypothetical protein
MATEQVTITVDTGDLAILRAAAQRADMPLSPFIVRCARAWALYEDAERAVRRDEHAGRNHLAEAQDMLAEQHDAEAEAHRRGHAA